MTSDSGDSVNYRPHGSCALEGPPNDALNFYSRLLFDRYMAPLPRRPGEALVEADRNHWLDPAYAGRAAEGIAHHFAPSFILRREDPS